MSAQEIIEQIKSLPPTERAAVAKFVVEQDDSWIPDEFKQAMKDAEEGRCVDMETALFETPQRACNEVSLPRDREILDEVLPPYRTVEGILPESLAEFQGKPI